MNNYKIIDEAIKLNSKKYIVSKTNTKGIITYGNDYFVEISKYSECQLIGQPHNIIRHPDMPKVIFKLIWENIQTKQSIMGIIKNLAKDGRYYWVVTEFTVQVDPLNNNISGYTAFRQSASNKQIVEIERLYKILLEIEKESGIENSEAYLYGFLEEKGVTYNQYINKIIGNNGLLKIFFTAMKKIFL